MVTTVTVPTVFMPSLNTATKMYHTSKSPQRKNTKRSIEYSNCSRLLPGKLVLNADIKTKHAMV